VVDEMSSRTRENLGIVKNQQDLKAPSGVRRMPVFDAKGSIVTAVYSARPPAE